MEADAPGSPQELVEGIFEGIRSGEGWWSRRDVSRSKETPTVFVWIKMCIPKDMEKFSMCIYIYIWLEYMFGPLQSMKCLHETGMVFCWIQSCKFHRGEGRAEVLGWNLWHGRWPMMIVMLFFLETFCYFGFSRKTQFRYLRYNKVYNKALPKSYHRSTKFQHDSSIMFKFQAEPGCIISSHD